ncbi:hypothetical protein [Pseudonocardia kunmingensis]|uniref:Helix-hairpin-helix protein n=1 Tax=Pseudonocardia kunmingensis TaxID=630975 RepID=A0A543DIU6_9PSEU|nr:hypothetical protein [Pseudonocardia kunmingensis]TQM09258.1 hypothetical protein FB558_5010 [Pseudonocardia kunmingensis]
MNAPMPDPHLRQARVSAPASVAPAGPRSGPVSWFLRGGWYLFVIVLSLGMLSFVPFVHAALRTRRPLMWLWATLYTAAVVALFLVTGTVDVGGMAIGLTIIAAVHSVVLRRQVWSSAPARSEPATAALGPAGTDPAVAAVLAARARRDEARRLAAADPQMARELRIGRPDLPRDYDDGGLVDLNSAPPHAIANTCGTEIGVAARIADVRAAGVVFATVEDVFSFADVPYPLWDRIRERAVVIAG